MLLDRYSPRSSLLPPRPPPPLARLFPEGRGPASCCCVAGIHSLQFLLRCSGSFLSVGAKLCQALVGHVGPYSSKENLDQFLALGSAASLPPHALPAAVGGCGQVHCQARPARPYTAGLAAAEPRIVFPHGLSAWRSIPAEGPAREPVSPPFFARLSSPPQPGGVSLRQKRCESKKGFTSSCLTRLPPSASGSAIPSSVQLI